MAVDPEIKQFLDDASRPDPARQPQQPEPKPDADAQKLGQVLNENAELRRGQDALRLELEALRGQIPRTPTQQSPVDPSTQGWESWANKVLQEVTDDELLASPRQALSKILSKGGQQLTEHASQIATKNAWEVGGALRADMEFTNIRPDLMSTDMGVIAVRQAIAEVRQDPRFQQLMNLPTTRSKAYEVIGKIADKKLGRTEELNQGTEGLFDTPRQQKGTFAATSSSRISGRSLVTPDNPDQKAMEGMLDYVRTTNRTE